ncbi:helix-turn-helix transcriptional regulator [Metapseudomonas resinovorans]|uniref:helix-turn-helix transcriptional regulator n=1 Tax=Metapseudomonas resinovorans TaxID=53412 RepID=UPI000987249B|nr:LuxR C-terminal-related transcriptional regulator [Pseudomonas resinovorans]
MSRNDQADRTITTALLEAFSDTVLELQRLARDRSIERFHALALTQLQQLLPFDKAWWGRAAMIDGLPEEHSSHLFNLPPHYLEDWQSIRHEDVTVGLVSAAPDKSVIVDSANSTPGLQWLGERHGFREFLCVIHSDPQTGLVDHLTLYRSPTSAPFNDQDQLLMDQLMRHLAAAVSANQIRTLVAKRESLSNPRNLALAVCDARGTLHCAERGFVDLLLTEWPDWTGPQLPESVNPDGYQGERLLLEVSAVGDLHLLAARSHSPLQQLSARENDVALRFGEGKTYKEIARDLGLAPNTVRHHIRTIYSKLGVKDKASIAHLLHSPPD